MLCDLLIYERSWLDRLHRHSLFPTNVTTPISSMLLLSSCCLSSKFLVHYSYSLCHLPSLLSSARYPALLRIGFPYHGVENYKKNSVRDGDPFFSPSSSHDRLNSPGATQRSGTDRDAASTLCSCLPLLAVLIFARNRKVWALVFFFSCTSLIISSPIPPFSFPSPIIRNLGGQVPLCFERANKYDTKPTQSTLSMTTQLAFWQPDGRRIYRWRRGGGFTTDRTMDG